MNVRVVGRQLVVEGERLQDDIAMRDLMAELEGANIPHTSHVDRKQSRIRINLPRSNRKPHEAIEAYEGVPR